jgi:type II secretory pathway component PulJ
MNVPVRPAAGFTLFEVLGVVFVTALVLGFATDYYIDLSRASSRASENTRDVRHAAAILDRIARDFESTLLVAKPEEVDPISHPWLFVAEVEDGDSGADHIKFVTRNFQPRRSEAHESDLTVVAYVTSPSQEDDRFDLYRWTSPQLPEDLDRSFPSPDDEASVLLAEGLTDFGVRFYDEAGEETDSWDSTTLTQSSTLPGSVVITVGISDSDSGTAVDSEDLTLFSRRVVLPLRPLDLVALLDPERGVGGADVDRDGDGIPGIDLDGDGIPDIDLGANGIPDDEATGPESTAGPRVSDCVDIQAWIDYLDRTTTTPSFAEIIRAKAFQPWATTRDSLPPELRTRFGLPRPGCN